MKGLALLLAGLGWLACAASPALAQRDEQESRQARLQRIEELLRLEREEESYVERLIQAATESGHPLFIGFAMAGLPDIVPIVAVIDVPPVTVTREDLSMLLAGEVLTGELTVEQALEWTKKLVAESARYKAALPEVLARIRARIALLEQERTALGGIVARVDLDEFWSGRWLVSVQWTEDRADGGPVEQTEEGELHLEVSGGDVRGAVGNPGSGYRQVVGVHYDDEGVDRINIRPAEGHTGPMYEIVAQRVPGSTAEMRGSIKWLSGADWKHDGFIRATKQ